MALALGSCGCRPGMLIRNWRMADGPPPPSLTATSSNNRIGTHPQPGPPFRNSSLVPSLKADHPPVSRPLTAVHQWSLGNFCPAAACFVEPLVVEPFVKGYIILQKSQRQPKRWHSCAPARQPLASTSGTWANRCRPASTMRTNNLAHCVVLLLPFHVTPPFKSPPPKGGGTVTLTIVFSDALPCSSFAGAPC